MVPCAMFALCFAVLATAAEIPAGTVLTLRLKSKVSSRDSKPKDAVEAVVIAPVLAGDRIVIEQGVLVSGAVKSVKKSAGPDDKAALEIEFTRMYDAGGASVKIESRVLDVDNARESVDDKGVITGILASQTVSARMDQGLGRLGERMSGFAKLLGGVKSLVIREADPEIVYDPGTELHIALTKAIRWEGKSEGPKVESFPDEAELHRLVNAQPFRTVAQSPPKPSDITNLMFIATAEELKAAFAAAGWVEAAALSGLSKFETFRSIAESRGYKEAPMSILLLDGQKPDFDFEKMLNTFAMRHHLRVWKRPVTYQGKPVWVSAATHDIGIELSPEQRNFIHKIDGRIDIERAKVVSDLVFTGKVKALALVDRPAAPRESSNATGDKILTDGAMAALLF
jgi:hypothetical protein